MSWLRRLLCWHSYSLSKLERRDDGKVSCPCMKCGRVAVADYGLLITERWKP